MTDKKRRIAAAVFVEVQKMNGPEDLVVFNEELGANEAGVTVIDRDAGRTYRVSITEILRLYPTDAPVLADQNHRDE